MSGRGNIFAALLVIMVCAFGFGVYTFLNEHFERGDTYPPYSSFRSDPKGTKALFLALGRMGGMSARRNYLEPSRLLHEKGSTFFFLGVDVKAMLAITDKDIKDLEALAGRGNRLVFAFAPVSGAKGLQAEKEKEDKKEKEGNENKEKQPDKGESQHGEAPCGCLFWRWKVIFHDTTPGKDTTKGEAQAVRSEGDAGLPETIPVRSSLSFRPDGNFWSTVYSVGGNPVLVERDFGRGSIVLLADSYLTSNGAMRDRRYPGLLLRLLGGSRTAVFDETHLGVFENPGVMSLVKKYRLTSFLVALLLLAALYLWKNSIPLVRSAASGRSDEAGVATDKDAVGGLISLLRRNIPKAELLDVCFREWTKSFSREYRESDGTRVRLKSIVDQEMSKPPAKRDPAAGYRRMARILAERK
jgi:hypothetical protein